MTYDEMYDWWEAHTDLNLDTATYAQVRANIRTLFPRIGGEAERSFNLMEARWAEEYGYLDRLQHEVARVREEERVAAVRIQAPPTPTLTRPPTQAPTTTSAVIRTPTQPTQPAPTPTRIASGGAIERAFASAGRAFDRASASVGRVLGRIFGRK